VRDPPIHALSLLSVQYRAPEILLGAKSYSTAVDIWSVGCIFAELLLKEPLFQAKGEMELIDMIFRLLGPPSSSNWPGYNELPLAKTLATRAPHAPQFRQRFPHLSTAGLDLLMSMLTYDPEERISAEEALKHTYFTYVRDATRVSVC
jgi:cell division cycle 2-like protein